MSERAAVKLRRRRIEKEKGPVARPSHSQDRAIRLLGGRRSAGAAARTAARTHARRSGRTAGRAGRTGRALPARRGRVRAAAARGGAGGLGGRTARAAAGRRARLVAAAAALLDRGARTLAHASPD